MSARQNEKIVGRTCQWVPPSSLSMPRTTRDEGPPNRHLLLSLPPGHPSSLAGGRARRGKKPAVGEKAETVAGRRPLRGDGGDGDADKGTEAGEPPLLFRPPAGRRPPRTATPLPPSCRPSLHSRRPPSPPARRSHRPPDAILKEEKE